MSERLSRAGKRPQRSPSSAAGTGGQLRNPGSNAAPLAASRTQTRRYGAWRPSASHWPDRIRVR